MVPHPLIHLKLARNRCDELLTTRHKHSRGASARRACALLASRLVGCARCPRPSVETHFARREANGITVDLYWTHGEHDDWFRVEVVDHHDGRTFTLFPATGKEAVEVYHHPFATTTRGRGFDVAA